MSRRSAPRLARRPSPAFAVAAVALFVALGGVSYAAATIGSAQIKDNSIRSKDIKNRSIATSDISTKARKALRGKAGAIGATGATGAPGPAGPQGVRGDTGPIGPSAVREVFSDDSFVPVPECSDTTLESCGTLLTLQVPAGSHLVQATATIDNGDPDPTVLSDRCGVLMGADDLLDEARVPLAANGAPGEAESISLSRAVTVPEGGATLTLRCNEQDDAQLRVNHPRLHATQVGAINP